MGPGLSKPWLPGASCAAWLNVRLALMRDIPYAQVIQDVVLLVDIAAFLAVL
jgi:hypothetical protein